jgi:copper homeostasis protein CutC
MAAKSVAWLSANATAEQVRLAASKYIIDGVVGGGFNAAGNVDDMLMALVSQLAENDVEPVDGPLR